MRQWQNSGPSRGKRELTLGVLLLVLISQLNGAFAAPDPSLKYPERPAIPTTPVAPPPITSPVIPESSFTCQRKITYGGKVLNCDTPLGTDAENLRPIFQNEPQATDQLDAYQGRQRAVRELAYTGSAGLLIAIMGNLLLQGDQNRGKRNALVFGGLGLTAGGLIVGFTTIHENESYLDHAIGIHNREHPEKPIDFQINTGVNF